AEVVRVGDGNVAHLGHRATADGRWRIYAFADGPAAGEASALADWAEWFASGADSPLGRFTPAGADIDAVFDVTAIYQQPFEDVDIARVPGIFLPKTGPLGLTDWEKVYAATQSTRATASIFDERALSRDGVVVVVRPDQYVAAVLPLTATDELAAFFAGALLPQN
ncbi:MAG: 3-hydroxybenzoate 4-monooxygenase, partial [Microbacterium sp.]|nr:3-hydroxybenzoate 4-monooxygenase [Microbacterium sp.]